MAAANAMCSTFKQELLLALHNFTLTTGHVFKIALVTSASTIGAATDHYSGGTNNINSEVANGSGYATGGNTLVNVTPTLDTTTGICSFGNSTWAASSITANGAMIYNSTSGNRSVVTLSFGGDKVSSAGDFVVQFPAVTAAAAIIRIA